MLSALSWVVSILVFDPFIGLILLGVLLTMLVLAVDPATGKAMSQVIIPIIIILFVFQVFIYQSVFSIIQLVVVGAVLYLMFAMFTGGGVVEGGFIDAKLTCQLFPIYGILIFVSAMADPTYRTTVYIMAGTIFLLMGLYAVFLRNYDEWPEYEYQKKGGLVAITDINPKGKVKSGSEIWWAKTTGPPIRKGEQVHLLGTSGLTMIVSKEEEGHISQNR
jgi:membrane-bound ClpP family serine protease